MIGLLILGSAFGGINLIRVLPIHYKIKITLGAVLVIATCTALSLCAPHVP